jgi:hypothetical protein
MTDVITTQARTCTKRATYDVIFVPLYFITLYNPNGNLNKKSIEKEHYITTLKRLHSREDAVKRDRESMGITFLFIFIMQQEIVKNTGPNK